MVQSGMASTVDIAFNCGDVIQLLHKEPSGIWYAWNRKSYLDYQEKNNVCVVVVVNVLLYLVFRTVRNVTRSQEGRVHPEDLHRILGETA